MPWAASFAFNNANLLPAPIDQRNNELKLNTEWVNQKGMFRLDYWGSFFENDVQALTWDNPIRATDFNNGLLPEAGPYDPSGYSNGNGPALGQAALWPSNILNSAGATGMFKLLPRTTVNGNVTLTTMRQNESLLPWSLNTSINNPVVLDHFQGLRALPRASAEASVNALNAQFTLNSRVTPFLTFMARYRYNDHNNNTPHFDGREYVRMDAVPEELADDPLTPHVEGLSEYFQITRKNFDASGTFDLQRRRIAQARLRQRAVRPRRPRLQRRLGEHVPSRLRRQPVRARQPAVPVRRRPAAWRRLHHQRRRLRDRTGRHAARPALLRRGRPRSRPRRRSSSASIRPKRRASTSSTR